LKWKSGNDVINEARHLPFGHKRPQLQTDGLDGVCYSSVTWMMRPVFTVDTYTWHCIGNDNLTCCSVTKDVSPCVTQFLDTSK
jgi:hypothetical protein